MMTSASRPAQPVRVHDLTDTVAQLRGCVDQEWNALCGERSIWDQREEVLELMVRLLELAVEQCPDLALDRREVARATAVLVHWYATEREPGDGVLARCRGRIAQDDARLVWQDPFSLRHVLTTGIASPEAESTLPDLAIAVARNDARAIHALFVDLGRRGRTLGSVAPLRALFQDCARDNLPGLWPFAFEFAVLERRLHGGRGWEHARAFIALIAQAEPNCTASIRDYLNLAEIECALRVFKLMDDRIPAWHFDLLRRTWTSDALTHLGKLVRMRASIPLEAAPTEPEALTTGAAPEADDSDWIRLWRWLVPSRRAGRLVLAGA